MLTETSPAPMISETSVSVPGTASSGGSYSAIRREINDRLRVLGAKRSTQNAF